MQSLRCIRVPSDVIFAIGAGTTCMACAENAHRYSYRNRSVVLGEASLDQLENQKEWASAHDRSTVAHLGHSGVATGSAADASPAEIASRESGL
jgi:hypothetical protein